MERLTDYLNDLHSEEKPLVLDQLPFSMTSLLFRQ